MSVSNVSITAVPVYQAPAYGQSGKSFTISNLDAANPVYFSDEPGTIDLQSSLIQPGNSESFDGSRDIWLSTLNAGIAVQADIKFGSVAAAIGNLNIASLFNQAVVQPIPVTASVVALQNQNVSTFSAIDVSLTAHCASQAPQGASVTALLNVVWSDDPGGLYPVYQEQWYFWVSNAANANRLMGTLPARGQYVTISVVNTGGGSQAISLDAITISGSYRTPVYSSFRQAVPPITITGTLAGPANGNGQLTGFTSNLASVPNVTPGAGLRAYLLPLYAGPVWIQYTISTAALNNNPTIVDMSQVTSGNLAAGTAQNGVIWNGPNAINTSFQGVVNFPRSPCALVVNPAATSTILFAAVAQQGY